MHFYLYVFAALLAVTQTAYADIGHHAAIHKPHLLVAPSFGSDRIELHPGYHPDHDADDVSHLVPAMSHGLHWSQEGHRLPLHGAKHAHMVTTFNHPTVVLEHSNHVKSVRCEDDTITVCFSTSEGMSTARQSWTAEGMHTLNLVTYHRGCGDQSGRRRSFLEASYPIFNPVTSCVTMPVTPVDEHDAIDSGDLKWGTYASPSEQRRNDDNLVGSNVRVSRPDAPSGHTLDMTTNATALQHFFSFITINGNGTETNYTEGGVIKPHGKDHAVNDTLGLLSYDGTVAEGDMVRRSLSLEKRNFFTWIADAVVGFVNKIIGVHKTIGTIIKKTAKLMIDIAVLAADVIAVPFVAKFERTYHQDIKPNYFKGELATTKPPAIADIGDGFGLAKLGGYLSLECVKCGIEAEMTVDGELSFSLKEGLTKGEVSLVNKKDFNVHTIFGLKLEGKTPKDIEKLKKQLGALPLSPIAIPGIFTLGPQVSLSIAFSLVLEADISLILGGTATIGPGTARLSLIDNKRNKLEGFTPSFTPVANATSGSITGTADLGFPMALEVGIDVLNGKFKKTVALVDAPSVYLSAQYAKGADKKCDGVQLRFGAKNRIFLGTFGFQDYTLHEKKMFETGLTCIAENGFTRNVHPDEGLYAEIAKSFGGEQNLAANAKPKLNNVAATIKSIEKGDEGFRLIMDKKESSLLVSGTDSYVYLVEKTAGYDISAPWGTLNLTQEVLQFDVFGRIFCFSELDFAYSSLGLAFPLKVCEPRKLPEEHKVAALSVLKDDTKNYDIYGSSISLTYFDSTKDPYFYFPTACKIPDKGLRIILTKYIIDAKAGAHGLNGKESPVETQNALKKLGVKSIKDCRTIHLTSNLQGSAETGTGS